MTSSIERRDLVHKRLQAEARLQLALNGPLPAGAISVTFAGIAINLFATDASEHAVLIWIFFISALLVAGCGVYWAAWAASQRAHDAAVATQDLHEFDVEHLTNNACAADGCAPTVARGGAPSLPACIAAAALIILATRTRAR